MTVRRRLTLLILGIVLPLILFAGFLVVRDYDEEKATAELHLRGTVRALSLAVEKELESKISALQVLALSPTLRNDTLGDFSSRATAFVALQPPGSRLAVADAGGHILLDTSRSGPALQTGGYAEVARQVHATARPVVSDLLVDAESGQPEIAVSVPVLRGGGVAYDLTLAVPATAFLDLLRRQRLGAGWIGSVLDRHGVHVAR